ncbi:MAG TPA: RHS repeat-associated core domain-containing protein [Clostridiales bacterium]|mgnify:FL=1|nr:MAG: tRNA3(Ser)-specific nuclease WapA precursor [Firmicutes bacterium ADurb.Bin262]HOU10953.1 RHS repeat-associated core domain-containing protein [Clostridiales bacterium]HQK72566.1 RHS repeat-associated core domain-containing protein [Clostridiales bacterium]
MRRTLRILSFIMIVVLVIQAVPASVLASTVQTSTASTTAAEDTAESAITGECAALRDEYTKVYRREDGSYSAVVSAAPLHFKQNGTWKDIDNTLVEATVDGESVLKNKSNDFSVQLPESLSDNGESVRVTKDGYTLSFQIEDVETSLFRSHINAEVEATQADSKMSDTQQAAELEKKSSAVTYPSVQSGVDYEYSVLPDAVKENIVLTGRPQPGASYSFTVSAPGMTAAMQTDSSIAFYATGEEAVFTLPAPFMVDDTNTYSDDIQVEFEKNEDGTFALTYIPSDSWLQAKERAYPVVIDPVVKIASGTNNAIMDTYVTDITGQQNIDHGAYTYATVGNQSEGSCWAYIRPGSYLWASKAVVTNATLDVYSNNASQPMTVAAYTVSSIWFESVTYNNMPTNDAVPIDYAVAPVDEYGQLHFDITKAFPRNQDIVNGAAYPHGVMLRAFDSSLNSISLYTSESQYTPVIEFSYVETTGLSDQYEYHTHSAGRAGTVSINDFTGGMYIERDELGIDGNIMPVSIKQYYSSACADLLQRCSSYYLNFEFEDYGKIWLTNYHRFVGFADDLFVNENGAGIDLYLYIDETGSITYFVYADIVENGLQKWVEQYDSNSPPKGLTMWVPESVSGEDDFTDIIVEEPSGQQLTFDYAGRMVLITAAENEHVTSAPHIEIVYRDSQNCKFHEIDKIVDGVGREYRFTYNSANRLTQIQAYDAQNAAVKVGIAPNDVDLKITYGYEGDGSTPATLGRLTTATYPDGQTATYSYVANHPGAPLIESIKDISNYGFTYTYDSKLAVTQIAEWAELGTSTPVAGNTVDITYDSPYQRTFEDSYGHFEVAQFDRCGRKIGSYTEEGDYQRTTYADTEIDEITYNLLSDSTTIQESNDNLVINSGFENGSSNWSIEQGSSYSPGTDSSVACTGAASYKMNCTAKDTIGIVQSFTGLDAGTYTFSACVNVPNAVNSGDDGAKISIETKNSGGTTVEHISSGFLTDTDETWQRLSVNVEVTSSTPTVKIYLWLYNSTGTAYFDNAKLELSDWETPYNVLLNSKMSDVTNNMPDSWTGTNLTSADIATTQTKFEEPVDVMKITGSPTAQKSISQSFAVTGGEGDVIDIGCWAKADAASNSNAEFRIRASYSYTDINSQTVNVTETLDFIPYADYWQYVADSFTLEGPCSQITVSLDYDYQINTAYFTDVRVAYTDFDIGGASNQSIPAETDPGNLLLNPGFESGDSDWTLPNEGSIDTGIKQSGSTSLKITCNSAGNYYASQSFEELIPAKYVFSFYVHIPEAITGADAGAKIQAITKDANGNAVDTVNSSFVKDTGDGWSQLQVTAEISEQAPNMELRVCLYNAASTVYFDDGRLAYLRYEYSYDSMGNLLTTTASNTEKTMVTSNTYTTDKNYPASATDAAGNTVDYNYNTANGTLTSVTDSLDNDVGYTYNAMRALAGVSQAVSNLSTGAALSNTYEYTDDRLTGIAAGNTVAYSFEYDLWGCQTEVSVGTQSLAEYEYGTGENRGRAESVTFGNGQTITYDFDEYNNVTGISFDGGTTYSYTYTYSGTNGLTSVTDNINDQITYFTGSGYEIYTIPQTGQGDLLYSSSYDEDDNFVQTANGFAYTYSDGAEETPTEAEARRTTGATVKRNNITSTGTSLALSSTTDFFERLLNSSVTVKDGENNLGSVAVDYTYHDGTGDTTTPLVSSFENIVTPTTGSAVNVEYTYTYDANGNILTDSLGGTLKHTYVYDEAGQLVRVNDAVQNKTYCYIYDNGGNMTSKVRYAYTTDTLGTPEQTTSFTFGDSNWKDKLTSFNSSPLTYDDIGNLISFDGLDYTWTAGRQLAGIDDDLMEVYIDYRYNADGLRAQKVVDDQGNFNFVTYDYIWADGKLVSQTDGTDVLYFLYDGNGSPIGFTLNDSATYLYIKNLQGDITGIADENGAVIVSYTYDAWGKLLSTTGSAANTIGLLNPLRYRGYYYDTETQMYYLQSRYYHPVLGRFINADGIEQVNGLNLNTYCGNNPVDYIDQTGHSRTYVFAYYHKDSQLPLNQFAEKSAYFKITDVNYFKVGTMSSFANAWNKMSGDIKYVFLYLHGWTGELNFYNETINTKDVVSKLANKTITGYIYLFSCKGGDGNEGENLAWALAKKNKVKVVACTAGVSYTNFLWGGYQARVGRDWFFKPWSYWYEYSYQDNKPTKKVWSPKWCKIDYLPWTY